MSGPLLTRRKCAAQAPLDACGVMETMNDSHVKQLLPRCVAGDEVLERFRTLCLDSKARTSILLCWWFACGEPYPESAKTKVQTYAAHGSLQ